MSSFVLVLHSGIFTQTTVAFKGFSTTSKHTSTQWNALIAIGSLPRNACLSILSNQSMIDLVYHPILHEQVSGLVHIPWTHPEPPKSQTGFVQIESDELLWDHPAKQIGTPSSLQLYVEAFWRCDDNFWVWNRNT